MRQEHIISGSQSAAANFSIGHYTDGKEIIDEIMDKVQMLVNESDNL